MSTDPNFDIEAGVSGGAGNAYSISGINIASGTPADTQLLVYNATTNLWEYGAATIAGIPVQAGAPADGQQLQYNLAAGEWQFV
jgi:hypothetical protein